VTSGNVLVTVVVAIEVEVVVAIAVEVEVIVAIVVEDTVVVITVTTSYEAPRVALEERATILLGDANPSDHLAKIIFEPLDSATDCGRETEYDATYPSFRVVVPPLPTLNEDSLIENGVEEGRLVLSVR
jgi:hypothetical protein